MELSEAEIQVLASLEKAHIEGGPSDRSTLEADADRFWIFREDWSEAYSSLAAKGLLEGNEEGFRLTGAGRPLARRYHRQRPDMYWYYYQKFYQAARPSAAHSELCRRVFGEDLCQEGQTDMASLKELLNILSLKRGDRSKVSKAVCQVLERRSGRSGVAPIDVSVFARLQITPRMALTQNLAPIQGRHLGRSEAWKDRAL